MAVFSYIATDLDATVSRGTVTADSPRQARDQLRDRGLSVHELTPCQIARVGGRNWIHRLGLARRQDQAKLTVFVRELSTLLAVGMPLLEALNTIGRQQKRRAVQSRFHHMLLTLRDRIGEGASLAEAMREQSIAQGGMFDDITISMTQVGEHAGTLDEVLGQLAEFRERSAQLKGKLGSAMLYPLIVLAVGVGVSLFLMTWVVPSLLDTLVEAGRDLPWITQVVKGTSDFLLAYWAVLLLGAVVAAGVLQLILRTARGRWVFHRLLLKLPGLGDLIRKQAIVRIAFVISTLMKSGISFEQAVATAQSATGNVILKQALIDCQRAVEAGRDIGIAMEQAQAFPSTVVQIFALGQQSGQMESMLERLALDYDRQVATAVTNLTAILEPVLILMLAAIVGAIAFATILPILEIGNVL